MSRGLGRIALFIAFATLSGAAELRPQPRIHNRVDDSDRFSLSGNTQPMVSRRQVEDLGPMRGSRRMPRLSLHFSMTAEQSAELARVLAAQQDRRAPEYHKFLTPEEYAVRFGPAASDVAKVRSWLEESGFGGVEMARGGRWVDFHGTAAQVERAFHVALHNYSLRGETRFANSTDPQLPKALAGLVSGVGGLNNFSLHSYVRQIHPQYTSGTVGLYYLAPDDWATIYDLQPLYGAGIDGSGVTIAVVGQSDAQLSDLRAFRAAAGLPAKDPSIVVPPGSTDPGYLSDGTQVEADLDLEWAGAIARNANILFVTASATNGNGIVDGIAYVIDNNAAAILSISFGECEANLPASSISSEEALFQQGAAEGITILAASGDSGATACDDDLGESTATKGLAVNYPASSAYVTAVGGTEFTYSDGQYWGLTNNGHGGSALSYIPEVVWNDGFGQSGGGGVSKLFAKPVWQTGAGVPSDQARDLPDVAFSASAADTGYLFCGGGGCTNGFLNASGDPGVVGGTSISAPSFAGLLALVMQKGGGNRLGNINANLYSLAQISTNAFHDVTSGSNHQSCQAGTPDCPNVNVFDIGYYAGAGYDLASGLGSVDGYNFAQQWFGDFTLTANPISVTIQPGSSASSTVSVIPQNNFNGPVTVTCAVDSSLVDVACSVPSGAVGANGTATVTISAASTARTTWWKRVRPPPLNVEAAGLTACLLLTFGLCYGLFKSRPVDRAYLHLFGWFGIVLVAIGAWSCGGGGSGGFSSTTPSALSLTCTLPDAVEGVSYSGGCSAAGGTAPFSYSLSNGALPAGFSLNTATGAISGSSATAAAGSFDVTATDSSNPKQSTILPGQHLNVKPPSLSLACQLPAAVTGMAYSGGCTGAGGYPPYSYYVGSGSLPTALYFNPSTGAISGTPTLPSMSNVVIRVDDSSNASAYFTGSFTVMAGPLLLTCNLPGTQTGADYNAACSSSAGTAPVTFSIASGALPSGIRIVPNGQFGGGAIYPGTSSFTVSAVDSASPPQVAQMNESILVSAGPLTIRCDAYGAKVSLPYEGGCSANSGTPPFRFSVASGSLAAGLSLNASTGAISGVPTTAGSSAFNVQVTDSGVPMQSATSITESMTVQPTAPLTLTCPAQYLMGNLGLQYAGSCGVAGGNSPYTESLVSGSLPPGIHLGDVLVNPGIAFFGGLPTAIGTSTVTLKITDSSVPAMSAVAQATITIGPRQPESGYITVTATSGGITNTIKISVTVP